MKILITGSRGYIGYNLIEYLKENEPDAKLIGLDSCVHNDSRSRTQDIPFVPHDILTAPKIEDLTHVVHLAGKTGVGESWNPNELPSYYENNVLASKKIFETYSDIPVLYATSSATKEMKSPYAMTKAMVEEIAPENAIGMRFFTVYGGNLPRTDMFYHKALSGTLSYVTKTKRDYTRMDFTCECIHSLLMLGEPGKIYDIGKGNPMSPSDFLKYRDFSLGNLDYSDLPIVSRQGESEETQADPRAIEQLSLIHI